jgi:hypothetical protein
MLRARLVAVICIYRYLAEGSSKCQARISFFLKLTRACVRATAREGGGNEKATQAQKPNEQHRLVLVVFAAFTICWRTIRDRSRDGTLDTKIGSMQYRDIFR